MRRKITQVEINEIARAARFEFSQKGGRARAKKLTKKRRSEIASIAGKAGGRGRPKKKRSAKRRAA